MPNLSPDEELELINIELEQRKRGFGQGLSEKNPQGMNFYPDNPKPPQSSIPEALARGAAEGLPFQKEMSAGVEKGIGAITDLAKPDDEKLYSGVPVSQLAQENRDINKQVEEEHPAAFTEGKIAGSIGLSMIPGMVADQAALKGAQGIARGAELLSIGKNPVTAAAIQGAAQGSSDAGPDNRKLGALVGGAAGALTAGVVKGVHSLRTIGEKLEQAAAESSVATLGMGKREIEKHGEEKLFQIGRMLQDDGVTGNLSKLKTIGGQIDQESSKVNGQLSRMYKIMDKRISQEALPTVEEVVSNIQNKINSGNFPDKRAASVASRKLNDLLTKFAPDAKLNPSMLRELAQSIEDVSSKYASTASPAEQSAKGLLQEAAGNIRTHIHSLSTELGPEFQEAFAKRSERSGMYAAARDSVQSRLAESFQPTQNLSHGIRKALTFSQPVKGAYQAGTKAIGGSAEWIANNTKALGKFAKPLGEAAQRGPAASAATHFILMQTNPEYRETFADLSEKDE